MQDRAQRALLLEHVRFDPMSGRCCYRDLIDLTLRPQQNQGASSLSPLSFPSSTQGQLHKLPTRGAAREEAEEPARAGPGVASRRSLAMARNAPADLRHSNRTSTAAAGANGGDDASANNKPLRVAGLSRSYGLTPVPQPDQKVSSNGQAKNAAVGGARKTADGDVHARASGNRGNASRRGGHIEGNAPTRRTWGSAAPPPPNAARSLANPGGPRDGRNGSRDLRVDGRLLSHGGGY